ncbi:MAG: DUF5615 family PIN-like protein [Thermomicrobium sp.]|nr:DUF5615 family PIN-like protein [Thermomicrobium sp.]
MRFLVDENVPRSVEQELRQRGRDVLAVRAVHPGAPDRAVLASARRERRILVTLDKDFAELAASDPDSPMVVLLRVRRVSDLRLLVDRLLAALATIDRTTGTLVTVEAHRVRVRRVP